ncbi:MAG: bifunctional diaminohydroxyphosphoribosylaminopyrimidine deaminase/5-amino-6-(5-phosphoribosylamino)uracil reductase RibD [Candidatus Omnitrophota bacterium]|nr:bifunctional diaminohydroxyphosphoribosylaminopyrimidine deaminase/5-amino-6-(5-phosphoribosylamino)uracil reductase RibD [Candidatus Omnitrophota bacterium]
MNKDERYMRMAIRLAGKAEGLTSPNPAVGALVVKDDRVVGKGYHERRGLPHAEVTALKTAASRSKGATLYVSLEPCDHFGMTPPCTDAIIKSGIKRAVIGMTDPNPITNGRGIAKLMRYGIKTSIGVLEEEARRINLPYIKYITKKIPYVTVKVAESIDGKIATATGDSRWITSEESREYVHKLRAKVDAVMVGVNTVLKDDPLLLSKAAVKRQPARIIVDSRLRTPLNAKLFSDIASSQVIIATAEDTGSGRSRTYTQRGAKVLNVKSRHGRIDLKSLFKALGRLEMSHILVEGGGELIWSLVKEGLVDRFLFFIAPIIIGGRTAVTAVEGDGFAKIRKAVRLNNVTIKRFGHDLLIEAGVTRHCEDAKRPKQSLFRS